MIPKTERSSAYISSIFSPSPTSNLLIARWVRTVGIADDTRGNVAIFAGSQSEGETSGFCGKSNYTKCDVVLCKEKLRVWGATNGEHHIRDFNKGCSTVGEPHTQPIKICFFAQNWHFV